MKDDRVYLIHILECIERIERYTEGGSEIFFSDTKTESYEDSGRGLFPGPGIG